MLDISREVTRKAASCFLGVNGVLLLIKTESITLHLDFCEGDIIVDCSVRQDRHSECDSYS